MNEVSYSTKISDCSLTALSVQAQGTLAAVGSTDGAITLMQLCDGLVQPGPNEKNLIGQMHERETKRERNLEAIKKQSAQKGGKQEDKNRGSCCIDQAEYAAREKAFFQEVGM